MVIVSRLKNKSASQFIRSLRSKGSRANYYSSLKLFFSYVYARAPIKNNQNYNYALLDLGGIICKSKNPRCSICPLNQLCNYARART